MWKTVQPCRSMVLFELRSWQLLLDVGIWGYLIVGSLFEENFGNKKNSDVNMTVAIINLSSKVFPNKYVLQWYIKKVAL